MADYTNSPTETLIDFDGHTRTRFYVLQVAPTMVQVQDFATAGDAEDGPIWIAREAYVQGRVQVVPLGEWPEDVARERAIHDAATCPDCIEDAAEAPLLGAQLGMEDRPVRDLAGERYTPAEQATRAEARAVAAPVVASRLVRVESRLREQGAEQGTIDAHGAEVRKLESEALARLLESVAGDPTYTLGKLDPAVVLAVAAEIRNFRA